MIRSEAVIGLPGFQVTGIEESCGELRISARFTGAITCPQCGGKRLRKKDKRLRVLRHESWGLRCTVLAIESGKFQCRDCKRYFCQRFPGILPRKRATEAFRRSIFVHHWDGASRSRLSKRQRISSATVERWFEDFLEREAAERSSAPCPQVLGIDEHFFTRRHGYATTFCDLRNHKIYDVALGRSEASLELSAEAQRERTGEGGVYGSGQRLSRPGPQALSPGADRR